MFNCSKPWLSSKVNKVEEWKLHIHGERESLVDISFSVYWPQVIPSEESCRMQKVTSEAMQGPHGQVHLASRRGAS